LADRQTSLFAQLSPQSPDNRKAKGREARHIRVTPQRLSTASFPISADDFRAVLSLLGEELEDLPAPAPQAEITLDQLAAMEKKYLNASPEVKERFGKTIERGPIGRLVKNATDFKCQLCEGLGLNPIGFLKPNGEPYVEAHHVMPVSKQEIGSLSASNVMTLCANHHRQLHYGAIDVAINATTFDLNIGGKAVTIPRLKVADRAAIQTSSSST
jgi:hypothetical protein